MMRFVSASYSREGLDSGQDLTASCCLAVAVMPTIQWDADRIIECWLQPEPMHSSGTFCPSPAGAHTPRLFLFSVQDVI